MTTETNDGLLRLEYEVEGARNAAEFSGDKYLHVIERWAVPVVGKPTKQIIDVETALATWNRTDGIVQEKKDGVFAVLELGDITIAAEKMFNGDIFAFDILEVSGQDVRTMPLRLRWNALESFRAKLAAFGIQTVPTASDGHGADFLQQVLKAGGEGCVLKSWHATYYDPMLAAKRSKIFTCRVLEIGPGQSVSLVDAEVGIDRGRMPLRGGKCDQVRIGSVLRVEALDAYASGKLRQAVPCREWLVSF
jgi:hypothetical protein